MTPLGTATQTTPFDSLLAQGRDLVCARLSEALAGMLDKSGDALTALINSSQDNEQRLAYRETRDKLSRQRRILEEQFRIQYLKEFEFRSKRLSKAGQSFSEIDFSTTQLNLVGDDDLKETLKVGDMANRLRRLAEAELAGLDQRMGVVLGDANLAPDDNPFCPLAICDAYKQACDSVDTKVAVKMVLLKLFDEQALGELAPVYSALNALLVQNGILPIVRFANARSIDSGRAAPAASAATGAVNPAAAVPAAEPDFFAAVQNMLANNVAPTPPSAGGGPAAIAGLPPLIGMPAATGGAPAATAGTPVILQGAELMSLLTRVQHGEVQSVAPAAPAVPAAPSGEMPLPEIVTANVLRDLKSTHLSAGMTQLDNMTLDIVALLFDQLFDDPRIPIAVKGLIGRLQICILKVAIADKAFFSTKTHPARRMLDSLGEISLRLPTDFGVADPLFAKLEAIVQELLDRYEDSVDIFDQVRERLQHLLDDDDQRVAAETRAASERIKQTETMGVSKVNAQSEVRARVSGRNLPLLVRAFLMMEWVKVLLVVHVQRGPHSEIWKNALSAMDLLIWSVRADHTPEERRELAEVIPGLRRRLQAGLKIAGVEEAVRERFFIALQALHERSLNPGVTTTGNAVTPLPETTRREPPAEAADTDSLDFTQVMVIKNPFGEGRVEVNELDFTTKSLSTTGIMAAGADKGKDTEFIKQLKVGAWVEFRLPDKVQPARLAYISPLRTRFLFVDRLGETVNECSRAALAIQFNAGAVVMLEHASFFERIMKGVVSRLAAAKGQWGLSARA